MSGSLLWIVLALSWRASAQSFEADLCKFPADALSASQLEKLNTTLGGRLITSLPLAAPCYKDSPLFDPAACDALEKRWSYSLVHVAHPTSNLWQNWNGFSCPLQQNSSTGCSNVGYPPYIVNVSTVEHVQAAVNFAREHRVRLNIKTTGHDYGGRSVQPRSLSIWMPFLNEKTWHQDGYTLQGCGTTLPGPYITAGAGSRLFQINRLAASRNLTYVAGQNPTLGLGGHLQGSGHGALSPLYGMATDQIVEAEIVTADGAVRVANECQNRDLFFAMRGGGGSTFGVATKFVLKIHPKTPVSWWYGTIDSNSTEARIKTLARLWKGWTERLTPLNAGGYTLGPVAANKDPLSVAIMMPNISSTEPFKAALEPIVAELQEVMGTKGAINGGYVWYPSWPNAATLTSEETLYPGIGEAKLLTSWLWDDKATLNSSAVEAGLTAAFTDPEAIIIANWVGGPGTQNPPTLRGGPTGVNPAWRRMLVRPSVQIQFKEPDRAKLAAKLKVLASSQIPLKNVAPDMGTYVNEADPFTTNFQQEFWGSNYPRLLKIKRRYDPEQVFWCPACVGSEGWVGSEDGLLCKKRA